MKWVTLLAVVITLGCLTPATVLPVSKDGPTDQIEMVLQSGEYRILPDGREQKIIMTGFGYRMDPGKPMLPEKKFLIALPPGARVQGVQAQGIGGRQLPGTFRIIPAPPFMPLTEPPHDKQLMTKMHREWQKNKNAAYSTDNPYPNINGRLSGSGSLRKYAYASVSVCPFSYQPLSGKLTCYNAVRITVHFSVPPVGFDRASLMKELMNDRLADEKASKMFSNFEQMKHLYPAGLTSLTKSADTHDYLIITADTLTGAISSSNFVPWKTLLGYRVRTVLLSDPEITSQSGVDLAEQIRNFLRNYYGLWGIQYVLFVGDYATVPMRYCYPDSADHSHSPGDYGDAGGSVPTDFYYADLSLPDGASWDSDGDGFHGEYLNDNPDILAEVYVGRIPTSDASRITYTLNKLVSFEQDEGDWKNQALHPGSILFFENQNHEGYPKLDGCTLLNLIETDFMSGWTVSRYSEQEGLDPSDFPWPAVSLEAFIDDWRTGQYGVVNWSGHGAPFRVGRTVWDWDDGDGVPETDGSDGMSHPSMIDVWCNLDDDYPSIVFAVSCNVGYPEPNGVGNLGIDLLTQPGFGAAAGIMCSSRPAYVSTDLIAYPGGAELICYVFNYFGISQSKLLGEAVYDTKYYCYQNYGWAHYAEYVNQFNFDLYGDPSMRRTGVSTAVSDGGSAKTPEAALLLQNYPNPFSPSTEIAYTLRENCQVKLEVFNVRGQRVVTLVNGYQTAGGKVVRWDRRDVRGIRFASGVYFYRLKAGNQALTKKMVLLK